MPLILEGIVTTLDPDGSPHLAPMGPAVDEAITRITLRPFQSSHTFENLRRTREGVLHVTDDVELLARAAVSQLQTLPPLFPAAVVQGSVLADACRWFEFRVREIDVLEDRARLECDIVYRGRLRDFFGFNRAKHAVVEAAILATRVHLLPAAQIHAEFHRLAAIVDKTAGESERRAMEFLATHVRQRS